MILVDNAAAQTWIFGVFFVLALLLSIRFTKKDKMFPKSVSQELRGFAIFAIIFSHIGYFLSTNQRFLWPFSIMAGVGVNLFLFLSGYGLSVSNLKHRTNPIQFYKKRLFSLYLPFWITAFIFMALDFAILNRTYSLLIIIKTGLGIFQTADIHTALNSPLWFFTIIIIYYLIFPLIFMKKRLWLSAIILIVLGYWLVHSNLIWTGDVIRLYKVHYLAFPLGMLLAWVVSGKTIVTQKFNLYLAWLRLFYAKHKVIKIIFYCLTVAVLLFLIGFGSYHSFAGFGIYKEQLVSLLVMLGLLVLFVIKKMRFGLLYIFGLYSYEIYLLHWPIISRYDFLYPHLSPWLATIMYLILFLVLGYLLNSLTRLIINKPK